MAVGKRKGHRFDLIWLCVYYYLQLLQSRLGPSWASSKEGRLTANRDTKALGESIGEKCREH